MEIRMLIADDEPKIRQGIASCRDWTGAGIQLAGMARNGRDLVEQCRLLKPDLCLVDICMPQMDGLDAMDAIREFLPEIRFIIISGYEEFEYARRAVAGKAEAYILKPIDEEQLWQAVIQAAEAIRAGKRNEELLRFAQKRLEEVRPLLFERFILEWLQDGFAREELQEELSFWQLGQAGEYTLLVAEHSATAPLQGGEAAFRERLFALYRGLEEQLGCPGTLWATLRPRVSLGVFRGVLTEHGGQGLSGPEALLAGRLSLSLKLCTRIITDPEQEFVAACDEMLRLLDRQRQTSPVIEAVLGLIADEYMNKELSLGRVAERMNISAGYLSRLFREEAGIGFSEYLIRTRVREAIRQMAVSDARIGEIADRVGYRSLHYFSNAFKKITGMSPGEYRCDQEGVAP